jgi:hypothetical protein
LKAFHRQSAEYRLSSIPKKALITGETGQVGVSLPGLLPSKGYLCLEDGIALVFLDLLKRHA